MREKAFPSVSGGPLEDEGGEESDVATASHVDLLLSLATCFAGMAAEVVVGMRVSERWVS